MTPQFLAGSLRDTSGPFRALCLLLVAVFLMGGGARADIQSLALLRPLAILLLFYGMARLDRGHIAANRFVLATALLSVLLLVLHLVPMPPHWWASLPHRELVGDIDRVAGLGLVWRPLSLAPDATWNALFAAMVPCAALVLGVQLDARERHMLLWPVLLLGGLSAVLAIAQITGPANSPLALYKVTNDGAAVGLFANRNHQALLLATLLPVLAVWAAGRKSAGPDSRIRPFVALLAGAALLLLLLVTGSRAGLLLAAIALASIGPMVPQTAAQRFFRAAGPRTRLWTSLALAGLAAALALLVALALWRGRGLALERLLESTPGEDMRFMILPSLLPMIRAYLPFGSGLGSFERVFQMHEPDGLLRPSYANHVHNDWLELALTGGIPALVLLLVALAAFLVRGRALFANGLGASAELRLARLGLAVILLAALASLGDYPLRVPSLACFFVLGVLWMSCPLPKNRPFDLPS